MVKIESLRRYSNSVSPEYKAREISSTLQCSVVYILTMCPVSVFHIEPTVLCCLKVCPEFACDCLVILGPDPNLLGDREGPVALVVVAS
jgi:hypothetical protein